MALPLDESQQRFCSAPPGHIRLLAPAGCGKTHCLLYRCKHLIDSAPKRPPRILVVTFTRAAREELNARLPLLGLENSVDVTTLNAWGFRRIKSVFFSPRLITSKADYHFAMLNQLQSVWKSEHKYIQEAIQSSNGWRKANAPREILNMIDVFKSLGFDHRRHRDEAAFLRHWEALQDQHLEWRLTEQTDRLKGLEVLDEQPKDLKKQVYRRFYQFWLEATDHLAREATFTLEDQKYFAFQDEQGGIDQEKLLSGAAAYGHVLVDEFQDINPLDLALIKAIVKRSRAYLTIAGDDDQAIFEWRGATPDYIIDPDRFFGYVFETYHLSTNYRSPSNIVKHSQLLIGRNTRRVKKDTRAASGRLAQIDVQEVKSITDALEFVNDLVKDTEPPNGRRVALISRKRSQIIPYQVYFASQDIHFSAAEDLQIFLSGAFNNLLELLDIMSGEVSRTRIVQTVLKLCDLVKRFPLNRAEREGLKKYLTQCRPRALSEGIDALASYTGKLKGSNENSQVSAAMSKALAAFVESKTVSSALNTLADEFEGLQFDFGKSEDDIFYTDPPFFHLAQYATRYGDDFESFIEDLEKAKDTLAHIPPFEEGAGEPLSNQPLHLMTALRSKGKEFDVVVMLDVVDGIWPHKNAETIARQEGERRVFYVAFTRARERVVILTDGAHSSPYIAELGLN